MEPRIQYAKTSDGVSIAGATLGEGPPLVIVLPPRNGGDTLGAGPSHKAQLPLQSGPPPPFCTHA